MLQPLAWQAIAEPKAKSAAIAKSRPKELLAVSRIARRAIETAMHRERVPAVLRQILAAHDDRPATRMTGDEMIYILRGIGLVVHQEAAPAETDILNKNRIHRTCAVAVFEIDAPDPGGVIRLQEKCHAMANAMRLALPDKAIGLGGELDVGARSDDLDGRLPFDAKIKALDAAVDRRAE